MRTHESVRPHRTLHLIDADNLLGDPKIVDAAAISLTFAAYRAAAGFTPGDHAVIATGCNGWHVIEVELAWPGACHRRQRGTDGADLALLAEATWAATCDRYDRVVIGSGDRIFIVAFDELRAADIDVDVVARRRSVAASLATRARGHLHFIDGAAGALRDVA
jgi:NYN domain